MTKIMFFWKNPTYKKTYFFFVFLIPKLLYKAISLTLTTVNHFEIYISSLGFEVRMMLLHATYILHKHSILFIFTFVCNISWPVGETDQFSHVLSQAEVGD